MDMVLKNRDTPKGMPFVIALVLLVFTVAVYGQMVGHDFLSFDDKGYVEENPFVQKGLSLEGIKYAFGKNEVAYWHPVTLLSHMLDCQVLGMDPGRHHLSSLLYHLANVFLVWLVLSKLTGSLYRSAFVAALFALHPVNVDSVAWIAERKNLLSAFFWLLTIFFWWLYTRRPGALRYLAVVLSLTLGLLAKPILMTLPVILLLLDFWPLGRIEPPGPGKEGTRVFLKRLLELALEKLPLLLLSLTSAVITLVSCATNLAAPLVKGHSFVFRVQNAFVAYGHYVWDLFVPTGLAIIYPYPNAFPLWQLGFSVILVVFLTALGLANVFRRPYVFVGIFWFFISMSPVVGLVEPGGLLIPRADRFCYIPYVGLFVALVWGTAEFSGRFSVNRRLLWIPALVVLMVLTALSYVQTSKWKDSETLFAHSAKVTRDNCVAYNNYANALMEKGDMAGAIFPLIEALRIHPDYGHARSNIGSAYLAIKNYPQAKEHLEKALVIKPDSPEILFNLAFSLVGLGQEDAAVHHYRKALVLDKDFFKARINLAAIYLKNGQVDAAISELLQAVKTRPESLEAHFNLGNAWARKGRWKLAEKSYRATLELDPGLAPAHSNLGLALIRTGSLEQARIHLQKALELSPGNPRAAALLNRLNGT